MKNYVSNLKIIIRDNLIQKIIKNSGIVFFGNSITSVFSIGSFVIIARQLGPESLAILVLAQTFAAIMNDLFNVQTWESMVKFGAADQSKENISNVVKTNVILDIVSAVVAFSFSLVLLPPVANFLNWNQNYLSIISLYCLSVLFNITSVTIGIPRLFNKFSFIAMINIFVSVVKLSAVVFALYYANTLKIYIIIYLCADILTNILLITYGLVVITNYLGRNWWRGKPVINKKQIRFIWWTNLRTIIRIPVKHLDVMVISLVLPIRMVGIYKVYKEIAGIIGRIADPIDQVIFPEFTKLLGSKEVKETASVIKRTTFLLVTASAVLCGSLVLSSKFVLILFFGNDYLPEITALYAMIVLYGMKLITSPLNSLFLAAGFAKFSFYIVLFTNTIYLISALMLGKLFGIHGLVLAYAIQWMLNKELKMFFLRKYSDKWGSISK